MPELRHDPLAGRWAVVAPGRTARGEDHEGHDCPFCPGHEGETPLSSAVQPGDGPWRQRAFPNRFPLAEDPERCAGLGGTGAASVGVHEVVVLSPEHDRPFQRFGDDEAIEVVRFLQRRVDAAEARARNVLLFVNSGAAAGASRTHPHAQVVALDVAFPTVEAERPHLHDPLECPLCRELHRRRSPNLVQATAAGSCWAPAWSSCAYELLIAPHDHRARFADRANDPRVALLLRDALRAIEVAADGPSVVVAVHTAPAGVSSFHWHIHLWPRMSVPGGFEVGTGLGVSTVEPEVAAAQLREALSGSAAPGGERPVLAR